MVGERPAVDFDQVRRPPGHRQSTDSFWM